MTFDPFHDCLYTDNMKELKEAVNHEATVIQEGDNIPGIIQQNPGAIATGAVFACLAIIGGSLINQHDFQQDVKHDRNLRKELLILAAEKLRMPDQVLEKIVNQTIEDNPGLFVAGYYKDPEDSTIDEIRNWWNGPNSKEIKAKMNVRFIPALKASITQWRTTGLAGIRVLSDPNDATTFDKNQSIRNRAAEAEETIDKRLKHSGMSREF